MKTKYTVALSVLTGAALGAAAIQGLHAQAKPSAYAVAEVDISNQEAFAKESLLISGRPRTAPVLPLYDRSIRHPRNRSVAV